MRVEVAAILVLLLAHANAASALGSAAQSLESARFLTSSGAASPRETGRRETTQGIAGSSYGVVAPVYTGAGGFYSYLRLFNAGGSTAVFTVKVVGSPTGTDYGSATFQIPPVAARQYSVSQVLVAAGATVAAPDTGFSFYVQSQERLAGYQHVTHSPTASYFGNASICKFILQDVVARAAGQMVLSGIHTSRLAEQGYPSSIEIHNHADSPVTYRLSIHDEESGLPVGQLNFPARANASYTVPWAEIESGIGWTPAPDQLRVNMIVTDPSGAPPAILLGQTIVNTALRTTLNMTTSCALAAPEPLAPRIASVSPAQGPTAGGTEVTVTGMELSGATLRVDNTAVTPISMSDTLVRLRMPPHDNGYGVISLRRGNKAAYAEFLYVPPRLADLPAGHVTTIAGIGRYVRDFGPAAQVTINPAGLAFDSAGNLYVAEPNHDKISRIRPDGMIERVTALGNPETLPVDGIPSVESQVKFPLAVGVDPAGNVYIPDHHHRIRRVDAVTGVISTIAGDGIRGSSGDGGPAVRARLNLPTHIAADGEDVFFIEFGSSRIRRIHLADGTITTFAGNGTAGFSGDDGPATMAQFNTGDSDSGHLALDPAGNLYVADGANSRIRRVDRQSGVITTFYPPPADLSGPRSVGNSRAIAFDRQGNLYASAPVGIIKVNPAGEFVRSWGRGGPYSLPTEGAGAAGINLGHITGIAVDNAGNIIYSDDVLNRVRRIDIATDTVSTVAGIGPAIIGENGPAVAANVSPLDLAIDEAGNLVFSDSNFRIRRIDGGGVVQTIAGTGSFIGQVAPAPAATSSIYAPGLEIAPNGDLELTEMSIVTRIDSAGIRRIIAGRNARCGYSGDGGPAANAMVCQAWDSVRDPLGNLFIADSNNNRIRRVDAQTGIISTVVGNGGPVNGYERYHNGQNCGDGGSAVDACIDTPYGVRVNSQGELFIANRQGIRKVDGSGIISTFSTIGGVTKLVFDEAGNLYGGTLRGLIRLSPSGVATWLAGGVSVSPGFSGDGGPATAARVSISGQGAGLAIDRDGNLYFADFGRIRAIRLGAR